MNPKQVHSLFHSCCFAMCFRGGLEADFLISMRHIPNILYNDANLSWPFGMIKLIMSNQ